MEIEYRERSWEMWLEGASYYEPSKREIVEDALAHSYKVRNLEVWFDNMEKFWRFNADIIHL